jgi:hypothetical protein
MCLVVHSKQHLDIIYAHEQIWPRMTKDGLVLQECYDMIVRSHSEQPVTKLYVLSPYQVVMDADKVHTKVVDDQDYHKFNWIFPNPVRGDEVPEFGGTRYRLHCEAGGSASRQELGVIRLRTVAQAIPEQGDVSSWLGAFRGSGYTLLEISFDKQAKILKFDAAHPEDTTYWVRLALESRSFSGQVASDFPGSEGSLFKVQPHVVWSRQQVLQNLARNLVIMLPTTLRAESDRAIKEVVEGIFRAPDSSTRIQLQWVSIVTGPRVLVLNPSILGNGAFVSVEEVPQQYSGPNDRYFARRYVFGSVLDPKSDPLSLARMVFEYIKQYASHPDSAKSKEEVTTACNSSQHDNISLIVNILTELEYVAEASANKLHLRLPRGKFESSLDDAVATCVRSRLYETDANSLTSSLNGPKFDYGGFRIDFDLAFA